MGKEGLSPAPEPPPSLGTASGTIVHTRDLLVRDSGDGGRLKGAELQEVCITGEVEAMADSPSSRFIPSSVCYF